MGNRNEGVPIDLYLNMHDDDAIKTAERVNKEIKKIFESRSGNESPRITNIDIQLKQLGQTVDKVREKVENIGSSTFMTKEYENATNQLIKLEKQYDSLINKTDKMNLVEQKRQSIVAEIAEIQRNRESVLEDEYNTMLEQLSKGRTDVTPYTDTESIKYLDAEITKLQEKLNQLQFVRLDNWYTDIEATKKAIEELKASLSAMELSGTANVPGLQTEAYKEAVQQLDNYTNKLQLLIAKRIEATRREEEARQSAADKLERDIARAEEARQREADKAEKEAQKIIDAEERMKQKLQERADAAEEAAERHANSYNRVRESLMGIQSTTRGIARLIPGLNTSAIYGVSAITRGVSRLASMTKKEWAGAINTVKKSFSTLVSFIGKNAGKILIGAGVIGGIILLINKIKSIIEEAEHLEEVLKNVGDTIATAFGEHTQRLLNASVSAFIALSKSAGEFVYFVGKTIVSAINLAISAIISLKKEIYETWKMLAQLNDGVNAVNKALSNFTSSLAYLRAAFSNVFTSILLTAEPALSALVDELAEVSNTVGMFIAKLLGFDSYTKIVKKNKDFADSLDKVSKKAKKASENLAGFDKLNVISSPKSTGLDFDVDFDTVELQTVSLTNSLDNLAQAGTTLGKAIRENLAKIPWQTIQDNARETGSAFAEFLNNLTGGENSAIGLELGTNLSSIVNAVTGFVTGFNNTIDSANLGEQLGTMLDGLISGVDWVQLSSALSSSINTLAGIVTGITKKFKGKKFAEKLSTALHTMCTGLDWNLIKTAADSLTTEVVDFLNGIFTPENLADVGTVLGNTLSLLFREAKLFAETAQWEGWAQAVVDGAIAFFDNATVEFSSDAISKLANGIYKFIMSALDEMLKKDANGKTFFDRIGDWISNLPWEDIGDKLILITDKIITAIDTFMTNLENNGGLEKIIGLIIKVLIVKKKWESTIAKYKEKIGDIGVEVLRNMFAEYNIKPSDSKAIGDSVFDAIANVIEQESKIPNVDLENASGSIGEQIVDGVNKVFPNKSSYISGALIDSIDAEFSELENLKKFASVGEAVGAQVANGAAIGLDCDNLTAENAEAFVEFAEELMDELKDSKVFDIHSPSHRAEREIGVPIAQGIVEGVTGYGITTELTTWFTDTIEPWAKATTNIWETIKNSTLPIVNEYKKNTKEKLKELKQYIKDTNKAMKSSFIDTWKDIAKGLKTPLQSIVDLFQSMINKILGGFDSMISKLNTLKFDIPEGFGDIGGKSFNLGLQKLGTVSIPKLAQGTVIPANMSKFLAVLGDNNRETEVVSPLSTIEQALSNVLAKQNLNVTFTVEGDPHGMFRVMQKEASNYTRATGRLAF